VSNKVSDFIADLKWTSMDGHLHLLLETFWGRMYEAWFYLKCVHLYSFTVL